MQATDPLRERQLLLTRRQLFGRGALGLGTAALPMRRRGCIMRPKPNV